MNKHMAKITVADIPHMLKMWDQKLNIEKPENVSVNCEDKKYWRCPDCGYDWLTSPKNRYRGSGKCPCHESNKAIRKGVNDVLTIVKGLDSFLDEDNDFDVIYTQGLDSSLPVNLKCDECGRKWTSMLKAQVKKDGKGGYIATGCPHYNTVKRKKTDIPFCLEVDVIMKFWDDKNLLDPTKTKSNSNEKAHFICKKCGYDWTTEIRSLTRGTGKCSCCELQQVIRKGVTDVFTLVPDSKRYFNFKKNKNIDIYSIPLRNSEIPIDWKCPDCGREWRSPLATRIKGKKGEYSFTGCQYCYLHDATRITPVSSVPKLLKYWNFKKNKLIDVNLTSAYANIQANWECKDCGYEWTESIKGRTNSNTSCPFCDGIYKPVIKGKNDVLTVCQDLAQIYDFEHNAKMGLDIYKMGASSKTIAHFKCPKCKNEWDSPINRRVRKHKDGTYRFVDCPACSNRVFRKTPYSIEFPLLAKMYREDLNGIPLDSIRGAKAISYTYYHWDCPTCGETFESTLNAMKESHKSPTKGCPYCSRVKLRKGESFADLHPEMMDEYDPDNTADPYNVFPNCKDSIGWICRDCGHHWNATFALRHIGGGNCPLCYRTVLIPDKNSFAAVYPDYTKYWADSNERRADEIFYNSTEHHTWHCFDCGMDYRAPLQKIINTSNSCPYCENRRAIPGKTSLKHLYPNIAKQLSPNDGHDADLILPNTHTSLLWRCDTCHYDYNASAYAMINGYTCPYCNDRIVKPGYNSFADKHQDLFNEMDEIANYLLPKSPYDVLDTSDYKFWYNCKNNPKHKYLMSPRTRLMFQKRDREPCLYCRGQRRKLQHFISYNP